MAIFQKIKLPRQGNWKLDRIKRKLATGEPIYIDLDIGAGA